MNRYALLLPVVSCLLLLLTGGAVPSDKESDRTVVAGGKTLKKGTVVEPKTPPNTVSTDDAYVNGHVIFVAPRVFGQVTKVLVNDNYRVKKGDVLVQLDKEPFQVQVAIKKAAVEVAQANLAAAEAQARGQVAQMRANLLKMEHAVEHVKNQIANLGAAVVKLNGRKENLELAEANLKRAKELLPSGGISKEDLDVRQRAVKASRAGVEALEQVYVIRVGLGLPQQSPKGQDMTAVPRDLDQNFSSVRQALADTLQSAALLGYFPTSWDATPNQAKEAFNKQDVKSKLDAIYAALIRNAPGVKQAQAKLRKAQADMDQALLNLRYCDIVNEIDGVVTSRNVNPGNNVQAGQTLMAVRSLTEIWIEAGFKETQLTDLRIGQRVRCEVDLYGREKAFEGRIAGLAMGTGETLLPPQNSTGNSVKIARRLPVRIELKDYDPDKMPLFIGLSVTAYVYYKEPPTGPHAGEVLQPGKRPSGRIPEAP